MVGGGIVGLAVADRLARRGAEVILFEKESRRAR
ncbi:FAD-dependent oxidoreductase [Cryobacterium serini]|nr:FAD-dependent oxidoreductase [Cryobacterium serini]